MAEQFPNSRITGVSNSASQRAFIEARAVEQGLGSVRIVTADMNTFNADGHYDHVVSVEMFEHMRNWEALLERIAGHFLPGLRRAVGLSRRRRVARLALYAAAVGTDTGGFILPLVYVPTFEFLRWFSAATLARGTGREAAVTDKNRKRLARRALEAIRACDERAFATHFAGSRSARGLRGVETRLERFPAGLRTILTFSIRRILSSCSASGNYCRDASMMSAISNAAFLCRASFAFPFILKLSYPGQRMSRISS